jgi:2-oxoisovalerate dehydrogenase E1 component beta subunit
MVSNPYDAKGLLIAAVEDPDPVIFFEPKRLYNGPFSGDPAAPAQSWEGHEFGEVPEDYYSLPLGKARIVREGSELTIVTYGTMVHVSLAAVTRAGIDAEVIDLRTLSPIDLETITASVNKTGRCLVVHEATYTGGYGGEILSLIQEHCFYSLEAPIRRVAGWDIPYPHAFEWEYFPGLERVAKAINIVMEG